MGKMEEEERLICAVCLKFEADTLPHLEEHWAVHFKHYLPDSDEEDEGDDESDQGIRRQIGSTIRGRNSSHAYFAGHKDEEEGEVERQHNCSMCEFKSLYKANVAR